MGPMKAISRLRVAQFGLGPIGIEALRLAATRDWVEVVGAVDHDPAKAGRDLSVVTGLRRLRGRKVHPTLESLLASARPDAVLHTAVSRIGEAARQIEPMIRQGLHVVSSCEELVFPRFRDPALAARLDRLCRKHGSRVVGTGVNPGFVMDLLPVFLTAVSQTVTSIRVQRVVDASTRRESLQRKIGSGLPPAVFRQRLEAGVAGHAGLADSLALLAESLGWGGVRIKETGEPVVAGADLQTEFLRVGKGETCGLHQRAVGKLRGRVRIVLDLQMSLAAPDPHDAILVEGSPRLDVRIQGGIAGDQATVAALVNTLPRLLRLGPGLHLVTDLPPA